MSNTSSRPSLTRPASLPSEESSGLHTENDTDEQIDGGLTAWLTVVSAFLNFFVGLGPTNAFGIYEADYELHQFSESSFTEISFIGSTTVAVTLSFGIFFGRACELYGHRTITFIGSTILVLSLVSASFCSSVSALIATQGVMQGLGGALLFVSGTAVPAPWFEKRRSLAMGIACAGSGLGGVFWSLVIRALITRYDYRWSLRISALISAVLLTLCFVLIKTPKRSVIASRKGTFVQSLGMFKDVKFVLLYLASMCTAFGYSTPWVYLPAYIQQKSDASPALGSLISAILNIGMICGRIGLGAIADSKIGITNTVVVSMMLAGVVQLLFWGLAGSNLAVSFVFAAIYGFFGGGYIGLFPVVLAHFFDADKLASLTGVFFTSELPGQLTGTVIAGAILTNAGGDYLPLIMYSGSIMAFGSLFALMARLTGTHKAELKSIRSV